MKTKLLFALLLCSFSAPCILNAQIRFNVNIGSQPIWGPVGYDRVDNYYLPEIESYYNVGSRKYMYINNGKWVTSSNLPSRYINYDLFRGYKVVINEPNPYLHFNDDRVKYISYRNKHDQEIIRDSREDKYYEIKNHPKHKEWKNKGDGDGNGKGKGKDKKDHDKKDHDKKDDDNN